jgi:ABC-type glycerol-3-phosphate transport system substrate-binding protein
VVLAGGAALAGCAGIGGAAAPKTQSPKVLLLLRPWATYATASQQTVDTLVYEATAPWRAQHPGVDIKIVNALTALETQMLSGDAPDVYHSYHPGTIFSTQGFTMDLTKYIKDSHASLGVFNQAQMALFQRPDGIRALPCYLGIETLVVNYGIIDQLGLEAPQTGWSYADYATLCTSIASSSNDRIVGGAFGLGGLGGGNNGNGTLPPEPVLQGFGGSYVSPTNDALCTVDTPQVRQAVDWAYSLGRENAITNPSRYPTFSIQYGNFIAGNVAMALAYTFQLISYAQSWTGLNWGFVELPSFPATGAPVTACTSDLYAINPATKYPTLSWDLLHWLTFEPTWQRSMMKVFLLSPALVSLWDEWVSKVEQYAPPLQNKNLATFAALARGGHAYPSVVMRYAPATTSQYMNTWGTKMWDHTVSVELGLTQMAHQINVLEQESAKQAGAAPASAT